MDLLTYTSQLVKIPPYRVGLALDNRWDKAWRLIYPGIKPTKQEIDDFLKSKFDTLAIETYYKMANDADCFFGFEYNKLTSPDYSPFVEKYFEILNANMNKPFDTFINQLSLQLYGNQKLFFYSEPSKIFLSNRYSFKSGGPCVIWERGSVKDLNIQDVQRKLTNYPRLVSCEDDYTSIEYIFDSVPPNNWISYQVSRKDSVKGYILDLTKVEKFISKSF